jgi:hypothetical protein
MFTAKQYSRRIEFRPWLVLRTRHGRERIAGRFKSRAEAERHAARMNRSAPAGTVYRAVEQ